MMANETIRQTKNKLEDAGLETTPEQLRSLVKVGERVHKRIVTGEVSFDILSIHKAMEEELNHTLTCREAYDWFNRLKIFMS